MILETEREVEAYVEGLARGGHKSLDVATIKKIRNIEVGYDTNSPPIMPWQVGARKKEPNA